MSRDGPWSWGRLWSTGVLRSSWGSWACSGLSKGGSGGTCGSLQLLPEAAAVLPGSLRAAVAPGLRRAERLCPELRAASPHTRAGAAAILWVEGGSEGPGRRLAVPRARAGSPGAAGATQGEGIVPGQRGKAGSGLWVWARPVATIEPGALPGKGPGAAAPGLEPCQPCPEGTWVTPNPAWHSACPGSPVGLSSHR